MGRAIGLTIAGMLLFLSGCFAGAFILLIDTPRYVACFSSGQLSAVCFVMGVYLVKRVESEQQAS